MSRRVPAGEAEPQASRAGSHPFSSVQKQTGVWIPAHQLPEISLPGTPTLSPRPRENTRSRA